MFPEIHLWLFRAVAFIFGNDLCGKNCCLTVGFYHFFVVYTENSFLFFIISFLLSYCV